ncbi:signal peptidase I [Variibacter gotjawalensis]|uniref:Signal peptidase I n=1 Tax=Variibacter gotjawalensis TaxID=1333996 RepID=A0A0S3PXP3_9BRAD|nr:signal peptidase I [Variibacter gotjawalensis]NIK46562.1 signal peptidase I [Variibacter gotjawalensis]RZS48466.1 signal peptidase I [Variibacter gotjawalensis]BAT60728.1 signal peptidase I [Variibacter gotjawalensis]
MKEEQGFFRGYVLGVVVPAVAFVLVFQTLLFRPYRIPSESMLPSLLVGDYIMVSKFSYGYSRFSMPFAPKLFSGRIWGSEPKRGDVVVFRPVPNESQDFVKRVVGLPGDRIQMINGVLNINGTAAAQMPDGEFVFDDEGRTVRAKRYRETLPGGVTHSILDIVPNGEFDNTAVYTVPAGHVFMMGDNRDDSADSRVPEAVGFVPMENLVGRADVIFFSVSGGTAAWEFWRWPWTLRFSRMPSFVR